MACTSHTNTTTCNNHTATTTCVHTATTTCGAHSGAVCPTHSSLAPNLSETNWNNSINTTTVITASDYNELRGAIDDELTRRSKSWPTTPSIKNTANKINAGTIVNLRNGINAARTWAWTSTMDDLVTGLPILSQQFNLMRDEVNDQEVECICNCNYSCTCQCNYSCTCQCNYTCTCKCNYTCTCKCNYACTCNCNESCSDCACGA